MKKLLFIGPNFFNYQDIISEGLRKKGYEVTYFDDRPSTSFLMKALIRLNKNLVKNSIKKYFETILQSCKEKQYDVVFVIIGQSLYSDMIDKMREVLPNAKFIFYDWDAIQNFPDREEFSKHFDYCYSFDNKDVIQYPWFKFVPLFYSESEDNYVEDKRDALYIGTIKKGKYAFVHEMEEKLNSKGLNNYFYYYIQSKSVFRYLKWKDKDMKGANIKDFKFEKINEKQTYELMKTSKMIVDVPMKNQNGLTIRTFEALGFNKKLITTNKNIVEYDFYDPQNIYVYEGEFDFNSDFFTKPYRMPTKAIKDKYSLSSFLDALLEEVK